MPADPDSYPVEDQRRHVCVHNNSKHCLCTVVWVLAFRPKCWPSRLWNELGSNSGKKEAFIGIDRAKIWRLVEGEEVGIIVSQK